MAHREVYPTRTGRYGTRMLVAGEPVTVSGPLAREMLALGRATNEKPQKRAFRLVGKRGPELVSLPHGSSVVPHGDDIAALRAEYTEKMGKKPFNGWDAATLREKFAAA